MNSNETPSWRIVTQVKSNRVVYFTDDPAYTPPAEGDWYFVGFHQGALPEGMTLRNCWGWRFNGSEFADARNLARPDTAQALLDSNKAALRKLLREKIDAWRRPLAPGSLMGQALRDAKLAEAAAVLAGGTDERQLKLLPTAAAARGLPLRDMAQLVQRLHAESQAELVASECVREEIAAAIDAATTQAALAQLRMRLMDGVAPEATAQYTHKPTDTTPAKAGARPPAQELTQEQLRLRVQLRLRINALRRPYLSEYLLDDVVLQHKGRIARQLVEAGDQMPPGANLLPLISHAAARGMPLADAANDVLRELDETAQVLLETEQMKDAMLARIARMASFDDIESTAAAIRDAQLSAPGAAARATATSMPVAPQPGKSPARDPMRDPAMLAQWRAAALRATAGKSVPAAIERVGVLTPAEFRARARAGEPFIIEGVVPRWPLALLTRDAFVRAFGQLKVSARVDDYVATAFTWDRPHKAMKLADYLAFAQAHDQAHTQGLPPYLGNQDLPEVAALCPWPDYFGACDRPKVWLGPAGTVTPLHCDCDDNLLAQVWGSKRLVLYPPSQADLFDPQPRSQVLFGSSFDPESPDYAAHPRAQKAQAVQCTVKAGDLLYLPANWMHHVRALEFSLSINRWSQAAPLVLPLETP